MQPPSIISDFSPPDLEVLSKRNRRHGLAGGQNTFLTDWLYAAGPFVLSIFIAPSGYAENFAFDMRALGRLALEWPDSRSKHKLEIAGAYVVDLKAEVTTDAGINYSLVVKPGSGDSGQGYTPTSDGLVDRPAANSKPTINEVYLTAQTAFGTLRVGDDDGAIRRATDFLPVLIGGQMTGDWIRIARIAPPVGYLGRSSDDASKILYETPRLGGIRFGASYAPRRRSLVETLEPGPAERDFVELASNYRGDVKAYSYELALGYGQARRANTGSSSLVRSVTAASNVSYGGFSVGAIWFGNRASRDASSTQRTSGLTAQGTYENGPYAATIFWHRTWGAVGYRASGFGLQWWVVPRVAIALDGVQYRGRDIGQRASGKIAMMTLQADFDWSDLSRVWR